MARIGIWIRYMCYVTYIQLLFCWENISSLPISIRKFNLIKFVGENSNGVYERVLD